MSVILIFLLAIAGVAGWWLAQHRVMSKPWLEQGPTGVWSDADATGTPTAKVALGVFLAVVGALFALFASAYSMRMALSDWQAPPLPALMWLNTAVLIGSSLALQAAVVAARNGQAKATRLALAIAGLTASAFLAGQLVAWQAMAASGYFLSTNPANSFFYLLTGLHGLHILGGLVALARTAGRAWGGAAAGELRLGLELCALYWHALLVIWIALFVLLSGWADGLLMSAHLAHHG